MGTGGGAVNDGSVGLDRRLARLMLAASTELVVGTLAADGDWTSEEDAGPLRVLFRLLLFPEISFLVVISC